MSTLDLTKMNAEDRTGDTSSPENRRLVYGVTLVEVATAHSPHSPTRAWLRCVRAAAGESWCMGELTLTVASGNEVRWRCLDCDDQGRVIGWQGSTCDLTDHQDTDRATDGDDPDDTDEPIWRRGGIQPRSRTSTQRILLVQSDADTRITMLRMLESAGMQVTAAATVREACDAIDGFPPGTDGGFDAATVALALRDGTYRDVVAHMRRRGHITQYLLTEEQA